MTNRDVTIHVHAAQHANSASRPDAQISMLSAAGSASLPAAERWAMAVWSGIGARDDLRTIPEWARHIAVSTSTLRAWCYVLPVSPRNSLILCRIIRALAIAPSVKCQPLDLLDVRDPRTLTKFASLAAVMRAPASQSSMASFLREQQIVQSLPLRHALVQIPIRHSLYPAEDLLALSQEVSD